MCYENDLPKRTTLEEAETWNGDGGGMAWVENGKVHWEKGIKAGRMMDIIEERNIQTPIVIHFRIATVGGNIPELTHPFPIDSAVSLAQRGVTDQVLFHNGHWNEWRDTCLKTMIRHKVDFPRNLWSDSRAMAWLASIYGKGILNLVTNSKVAVLTPNGIERYSDGWTTVDNALCSNDTFQRTYYNGVQTYNNNKYDDEFEDLGYWKNGTYHSYNKQKQLKSKIIETSSEVVVEEDVEDQLKSLKEEMTEEGKQVDQFEAFSSADDMIQHEIRTQQSIQNFINDYDGIGDDILATNFAKEKGFKGKYLRVIKHE